MPKTTISRRIRLARVVIPIGPIEKTKNDAAKASSNACAAPPTDEPLIRFRIPVADLEKMLAQKRRAARRPSLIVNVTIRFLLCPRPLPRCHIHHSAAPNKQVHSDARSKQSRRRPASLLAFRVGQPGRSSYKPTFAAPAAFRLSLTHFYNCFGGAPIAAPSKTRQEMARMWEKAQNRSFSACMSHSTRTASPAATSIVSGPCRRLAGFGHHNLWIIVGKTSGEAVVWDGNLSCSKGYGASS
jgi:hypothetical protein